MSKTILALDQATHETGWSIFKDGQLISFGHWTFSQKDVAVRIHKICQEIAQKIKEYDITFVAFENIQLQHSNVEMYQVLAWLQGAIIFLCQDLHIEYRIIFPTEWRNICDFLKGQDRHRSAQKKLAQQWVLDTYGQKCTEDEADAICIGHAVSKDEDSLDWS